ncbi:MAG: hypothetical protein HQK51_21515, partial [Oligoflexia bacterium]|nr:hypothetical protein [Oligoflexia bacterium]
TLAHPKLWGNGKKELPKECAFLKTESIYDLALEVKDYSGVNYCSKKDMINLSTLVKNITNNDVEEASYIDVITQVDGAKLEARNEKNKELFDKVNKYKQQDIRRYYENTTNDFVRAINAIIDSKGSGFNLDNLEVDELKIEELVGRVFVSDKKDKR